MKLGRRFAIAAVAGLAVLGASAAYVLLRDRLRFEEVGAAAGVRFEGSTFGAGAWGDFDADGFPDLFDPHHYGTDGRLYRNRGDGTFEDVTVERFPGHDTDLRGDFHGSQFVDLDDDGDLDLVVCTGANFGTSQESQRLFVQEEGRFVDRAAERGVDFPLGRGRTPLFLPAARGSAQAAIRRPLDLLVGTQMRADGRGRTALFLSDADGRAYRDASAESGLPPLSSECLALADLSQDGVLDLIVPSYAETRVYDVSELPFRDITAQIGFPEVLDVGDVATGDFDGDGLTDVFLAVSQTISGFLLRDAHTLDLALVVGREEQGVRFTAPPGATLEVECASLEVEASHLHVGSAGVRPAAMQFELRAEDPAHHGLAPRAAGEDRSVHFGVDDQGHWTVLGRGPGSYHVQVTVRCAAGLSEPEPVGFDPDPEIPPDRLLLARRDASGKVHFEEVGPGKGLERRHRTISVVAADLDGDLDLDLVTLEVRSVRNAGSRPLVHRNRGDATFTRQKDSAGLRLPEFGRADSIAVVDFDRDGALDLYLTSGEGQPPFSEQGDTRLYRNLGPSNHWLEVALVGTRSNKSAIGAKLVAKVGDHVLVREQGGGIHRFTQNDASVLHFGLGPFEEVTELTILWPSGTRQVLTHVAADQVLTVPEP